MMISSFAVLRQRDFFYSVEAKTRHESWTWLETSARLEFCRCIRTMRASRVQCYGHNLFTHTLHIYPIFLYVCRHYCAHLTVTSSADATVRAGLRSDASSHEQCHRSANGHSLRLALARGTDCHHRFVAFILLLLLNDNWRHFYSIVLLTDTTLLGVLVVLWHLRRPNFDVLA